MILTKTFYPNALSQSSYQVTKNRNDQKGHRPRPIKIATTNARNLKNRSPHLLSFNPEVYQMVRVHDKVAAAERRWKLKCSTSKQGLFGKTAGPLSGLLLTAAKPTSNPHSHPLKPLHTSPTPLLNQQIEPTNTYHTG